jgi:hypothetical protein
LQTPLLQHLLRYWSALPLALLPVAAGFSLGQWRAGMAPAAHEATIPDAPAADIPGTLQLRLDVDMEAFGSRRPPAAQGR